MSGFRRVVGGDEGFAERERRRGSGDGIKYGRDRFNVNSVLNVGSVASIVEIEKSANLQKIKMIFNLKTRCLLLLVVILLIMAMGSEAQLNFSTGWGKRSQLAQTTGSMCAAQGKPPLHQMLAIYNLIQNEAQRMLECQKIGNK